MLYPARRRRAAGEKTARDGKRLKRLELEELKKLAKFANGVGEDRSVRQGGRFSDGGPGRDFGRRVSIGGVPRYLPARINRRRPAVLAGAYQLEAFRGTCRRSRFPSADGFTTPRPDGLWKTGGKSSHLGSGPHARARRSRRVCGARSAHDRKASPVQQLGRFASLCRSGSPGDRMYTQSRDICEMNPRFRNGGTVWLSVFRWR
jgi:hypothetical protein